MELYKRYFVVLATYNGRLISTYPQVRYREWTGSQLDRSSICHRHRSPAQMSKHLDFDCSVLHAARKKELTKGIRKMFCYKIYICEMENGNACFLCTKNAILK